MAEETVPLGLTMSLDDLIKKQREKPVKQPQRQEFQGVRGRGRGFESGRGRGRGRGGNFVSLDPPAQEYFPQQHQHGSRGRGRGRGGRFHDNGPRVVSVNTPHEQRDHHNGRRQNGEFHQQPRSRGGYHKQPVRPYDYKQDQSCVLEEETGDIVFSFKDTEIVRISPSGEITLDTGGFANDLSIKNFNDALNCINIRVTSPSGQAQADDWMISDGKSLTRYADGVVLPAKGEATRQRGSMVLRNFENRGKAAAATGGAQAGGTLLPPGIGPGAPFTGGPQGPKPPPSYGKQPGHASHRARFAPY